MKCETPDGADLPSHVLPCPRCGHRMVVSSTELTDRVTHVCHSCHIEVSRVFEDKVPPTTGRLTPPPTAQWR